MENLVPKENRYRRLIYKKVLEHNPELFLYNLVVKPCKPYTWR